MENEFFSLLRLENIIPRTYIGIDDTFVSVAVKLLGLL